MLRRKGNLLLCSNIFLVITLSATAASHCQKPDHQAEDKRMTKSKHFVLVHGSCLGAWSWYKLITLLELSGHRVTAVDLAASGVNPLQALQLNSISECFQPLTDFMASLPCHERVILVGHSLGGLAVSYAMEKFHERVAVGVFVTAQMPGPALNVSLLYQQLLKGSGPMLDNKYTYDEGPNNPPTTFLFGPSFLSQKVNNLSPPEDVSLGLLLIRPLRLFDIEDMSKALLLTEEKYGSSHRIYIVSGQDMITNQEVEKWMIEKNPPTRVETINGSDHMIMVSQPVQLSSHLLDIAIEFD